MQINDYLIDCAGYPHLKASQNIGLAFKPKQELFMTISATYLKAGHLSLVLNLAKNLSIFEALASCLPMLLLNVT